MSEPESLIAGWLEGDLDEAEQVRLESWLRENPDHMDRLVEESICDQQLREAVQISESRSSVTFPKRRRRFGPTLAAAAAVVICGFGAALWFTTDSTGSGDFAEVLAAEKVFLDGRDDTPGTGEKFAMGPVSLRSGRLELLLVSGVRLKMIGPLEAELIDDMHLRLKSGRLNANVGERGKGFTVYTEAGDVVDLGTEFGIEVDEDGESRVAVFSGKVEVHPRDKNKGSGEGSITLNEGQAARFSALAGLRRWDKVALAAKAAGISDDDYAGIVRGVRDNLGDDELHPFYGVVSKGMREGALAHTDKPNPAWWAVEGQEFPKWLEGADQVRTYHQFRWRLRYELQLDLSAPAVVYVFQDVRETAPEWLRRDFIKTGARLQSGPWNPAVADEPGVLIKKDGPYLTADIWKREVPAGVVKLGPPRDGDADGPVAMYGIAVQALTRQP